MLWVAATPRDGVLRVLRRAEFSDLVCMVCTTQSRSRQLKLDSPIGPFLWTLGGKRHSDLRNSARISELFDMSSEPAARSLLPRRTLPANPEGEDVMTCCAAAICAVGRHSVSSPLPVLGCSALPRHCHACLGAQSCDRARVASACAGNNPQGCSSPRPLCSGVTNQVSAETRLPDYPIPMPSLCSRPRCSG